VHWTEKQRAVASLFAQSRSYSDIVAQGFSQTMVTRVKRALDKGDRPPTPKSIVVKEVVEEKKEVGEQSEPLVSGKSEQKVETDPPPLKPVTTAVRTRKEMIPFEIDLGKEVVPLDRSDIYESYLLYKDLKSKGFIRQDSLSNFILDGVSFIYRVAVSKIVIEDDEVRLEEDNGRNVGCSHREGEGAAGEAAS